MIKDAKVGSRFSLVRVIEDRGLQTGIVIHSMSGWWSHYILSLCPRVRHLLSIDERNDRRIASKDDARFLLSEFAARSEWVNGPGIVALLASAAVDFVYLNQPDIARGRVDFTQLLSPAWGTVTPGGLLMVDGYRKGSPESMQPLLDFAVQANADICLTSEPWSCTAVMEKPGGVV